MRMDDTVVTITWYGKMVQCCVQIRVSLQIDEWLGNIMIYIMEMFFWSV